MDKGAFIAEVRKREYLWNRNTVPIYTIGKSKYYKLWDEVANIFGISRKRAQLKWRIIRDQFYKHINSKDIPIYTTGDSFYIESKDKPNWKHFNDLMFVLQNYKPKQNVFNANGEPVIEMPSSCNSDEVNHSTEENSLASLSQEQYNDSDISEVDIKEVEPERIYHEEVRVPIIESVPPCAMVQPQQPATSFSTIKRIYTLEETDDLGLSTSMNEQYGSPSKKVALESNVNQSIEPRINKKTNDDDENLIFFRSLLPFMRKLDLVQQLRVRMRCQESLLQELGEMRRN